MSLQPRGGLPRWPEIVVPEPPAVPQIQPKPAPPLPKNELALARLRAARARQAAARAHWLAEREERLATPTRTRLLAEERIETLAAFGRRRMYR